VLMDIDNCAKSCIDSLQDANIFENDVQIQKLLIERGKLIKNGGVTITIEEIKEFRPV